MKHNIVFPLSPCLGKLRDGTELRYALRGLARHFKGEYEVTVIGPKKPDWYHGRWIEQKEGRLKKALRMAAEEFPAGFFWWYDDCVLIADQTPEECMITPSREKWGAAQTTWGNKLEKIRKRLMAEKIQPWDYSRPHGPYWYDASMIDETWADWSNADLIGKFPFESWILSKRDWPRRFGVEKQYYGAWKGAPGPGKIFVNWCDRGFTPELQGWLAERFTEEAPEEIEPKRVKVEVHTLRYGDAWWVRNCAPTLDQWAKKHGHVVKVWTDENVNPAYPNPKFQEIDMLQAFLEGDADWLFYVDADVWVHPEAPPYPELVPGMHMMPDPPSRMSRLWPQWVRRYFGKKDVRGWTYRNAGVWLCDREAAAAVLAQVAEPYVNGVMDQNQWNMWVCGAMKKGLQLNDLAADWNSFSGRMSAAHFQHIAGRRKAEKWERLKAAGLLWEIEPESDEPAAGGYVKTFDLEKYPLVASEWMQMDDRHIHALHAAAVSDWVGSRVAVEIGPWKGRTTAALIEALNIGKLDHLHVIEVKPTRELRAVLACAVDQTKVTLHTIPSWDLQLERADFVFIDGDHRWPALADTLRALTWGAKVICMHDSQAFPRLASCWGSHNAARMLKQHPGRVWVEDAEDRPNEKTFRGFLVSKAIGTTDHLALEE